MGDEPLIVSTYPQDPEMEFEIELTVKMQGYGKRRGRHKLAEAATKALRQVLQRSEADVQVYYDGRLVVPTDHRDDTEIDPWYMRERNPCA